MMEMVTQVYSLQSAFYHQTVFYSWSAVCSRQSASLGLKYTDWLEKALSEHSELKGEEYIAQKDNYCAINGSW